MTSHIVPQPAHTSAPLHVLQPRSTLAQPLSPSSPTTTLCADNTHPPASYVLDVNDPDPQVITSYVVITRPLAPRPRLRPQSNPVLQPAHTPAPLQVIQPRPTLTRPLSPTSSTTTLCVDDMRSPTPHILDVNDPNPEVITSYVVIMRPLAPRPRPRPRFQPRTTPLAPVPHAASTASRP